MNLDIALAEESRTFSRLMSETPPHVPVPTCPGWSAADLLWHLTEVQMFWGLIVERQLQDSADAEPLKGDRPDDYHDLLAMFERESKRLSTALADTADDVEVWTWSDDHSVGFVRRRQAHEALIHRVDAEAAAGRVPGPIDMELAADGVDEVLRVMAGGVPEWATFEPEGVEVRIVATDAGRTWGAAFGQMQGTSPNSGKTYDIPALTVGMNAVSPNAAVSGTAADLDLYLWGRGSLDGLTVEGDATVVPRLRQLMHEATQ
jgi:uncharacterized protein (TIGR03083 family)